MAAGFYSKIFNADDDNLADELTTFVAGLNSVGEDWEFSPLGSNRVLFSIRKADFIGPSPATSDFSKYLTLSDLGTSIVVPGPVRLHNATINSVGVAWVVDIWDVAPTPSVLVAEISAIDMETLGYDVKLPSGFIVSSGPTELGSAKAGHITITYEELS